MDDRLRCSPPSPPVRGACKDLPVREAEIGCEAGLSLSGRGSAIVVRKNATADPTKVEPAPSARLSVSLAVEHFKTLCCLGLSPPQALMAVAAAVRNVIPAGWTSIALFDEH